jgi:hypothetical protein
MAVVTISYRHIARPYLVYLLSVFIFYSISQISHFYVKKL